MFIVAIEAKRCKGCGLRHTAARCLSLATGEFNGKGYTPARAGDMSLHRLRACYRMSGLRRFHGAGDGQPNAFYTFAIAYA